MTAPQPPVAIHDDVLASHLPEETILLHMGSKKYYRLNETGAAIWKALEEGSPPEAIVDRLVEAFQVGTEEARSAVEEQLADLVEAGLIERHGEPDEGAGAADRETEAAEAAEEAP